MENKDKVLFLTVKNKDRKIDLEYIKELISGLKGYRLSSVSGVNDDTDITTLRVLLTPIVKNIDE